MVMLSDGVFAIAMTLLVIDLGASEITTGEGAPDLAQQLWSRGPRYLSYLISFLVIGSYWNAHRRIFSYVVRADDRLVSLNLLLLLCIAFQPFPTSVLGNYGDQPTAVTFYAATLTVTGLVMLALWLYATAGRRLVSPRLDRRLIEHHLLRAASVPLVFAISMAIAQVHPTAAEWSWLVIAVILNLLRWRYRDAT